ncbi:MAG: response regulator transcription factor [Mariniphaga sp.]
MEQNIIHDIIIADSQFLVIEALKSLIGAEERFILSGIASNQVDLNKLLKQFQGSLLIVDFVNIDFQGVDDLKLIRQNYPQLSVLVLTNSLTTVEFASLSKVGIRNIIYKNAAKEVLIEAFHATLNGEEFYSDEISGLSVYQHLNRVEAEFQQPLTASEIEIVKLIADGLTTRKIASYKAISHHTVNTHRRNIFRKVEVSNVNELILHAIKSGWIDNVEYYI